MSGRNLITSVLFAILVSAPGLGSVNASQEEAGETGMAEQGTMMASCKAMMEHHEQMKSEMEAANGRLDELLAKIESKHGVARVDALFATVTELAMQHRALQQHLVEMQPQMMSHMMEHMQGGMAAMKSGEGSMMKMMGQCPMMQGSSDDETPMPGEKGHAAHHPGS